MLFIGGMLLQWFRHGTCDVQLRGSGFELALSQWASCWHTCVSGQRVMILHVNWDVKLCLFTDLLALWLGLYTYVSGITLSSSVLTEKLKSFGREIRTVPTFLYEYGTILLNLHFSKFVKICWRIPKHLICSGTVCLKTLLITWQILVIFYFATCYVRVSENERHLEEQLQDMSSVRVELKDKRNTVNELEVSCSSLMLRRLSCLVLSCRRCELG